MSGGGPLGGGALNICAASCVLSSVRASLSISPAFFAIVVTTLACAGSASAQDTSTALRDARAVSERIDREIGCLTQKHDELDRVVNQMRDAMRQQGAAGASAEAREHATLALRSLSQRAVRIERSIAECRTELSARARRPGPAEGVETRPAPHDPAAASVGQPGHSLRVIERDVVLQPNVGVQVGEQVDGTGRVAPEEVRAAVRGAASRFSRCYDQLVDRGALERGTIVITFRITASRRTRGARAHHGTLTDRRFVQCMTSAASRIRFSSAPQGGDAVYSYTLRFPGQ